MADASDLQRRLDELADGPVDAPERLAVLAELGWQLRFEDWSLGEALSEEARRLATAPDQLAVRAKAGRSLVMYRRWRHAHADGLAIAHETLAEFRELGDLAGCAAVLDGLSTIVLHLGDIPAALEHAREAYDLSVEISDLSRQGWALTSIGAVHAASGDQAEALRVLEQARDVFTQAEDWVGAGRTDLRLGEVLLKMGDVEGARRRFEVLERLTSSTILDSRFADSGLGDVARVVGDFAEARRRYENALAFLSKLGTLTMWFEVHLSLVRLCLDEDRIEEATTRLQGMLPAVERSGAKPLIAQVHELSAETCERRGDFRDALVHFKEASRLRGEVLGDEARAKLQHERFRRELDSAKKDAEISRLRFVELANMQAKLVETEKLAALGQLAAGVAHELNTPLGALQSNLDLLQRSLSQLEEALQGETRPTVLKPLRVAAAAGGTSELAVKRVARFVRNVTNYSGVDRATSQPTELRSCFEAVLGMLRPNLPSGVKVTEELEDVPVVWAQPARVNQALMTIIVNAAEAMKEGSELSVRLTHGGGEVVAEVTDRSRDLSEGELDRLFDVAFETSGDRVQLALGMPSVASAMNDMGGKVEAESEPGKGTTIRLRFSSTAAP